MDMLFRIYKKNSPNSVNSTTLKFVKQLMVKLKNFKIKINRNKSKYVAQTTIFVNKKTTYMHMIYPNK